MKNAAEVNLLKLLLLSQVEIQKRSSKENAKIIFRGILWESTRS